jgi:ADP-heptose:LPS heptosyltransferase
MVGQQNVYFLVFEDNRFILDAMKLIAPENVLTIRSDRLSSAVADAFRAIQRMQKLRIDAAIDLEFFARSSSALTYFSGARCRVGLHAFGGEGPYRGDLVTHRLRFNPYLHTSQTFRMMVEALDVPADHLPTYDTLPVSADELPPPFEPGPGEVEEARALLRKAAGTEHVEPLILLNANCSDLLPLRRWPADRYVELARRLLAHYPEVWVAMTGSPSEAAAVAALVDQVRSHRCFNLGGRTTLQQLLVIYGLAEVLVTNDSGPAHFAALTGINVVTLFGPEHPKLFAARTTRNHVFWEGIACSPCLSALNNRTSRCRNNVCMQRIDVDRVFDRVCRLYETRKQNTRPSGGA